MPTLTAGQIAAYAQSAGLSPDRAKVAAAIAMAESGGRTDARNPVPPDNSYGLWQINMLGAMGPDRRRKLGISSNEQLFDPAVNARAMAMISNKGANFRPWTTYTSGAYKKHLNGASADPAVDLPGFDWGEPFLPTPDALDGIGDALSGITAMAELTVGAALWLGNPHNWVRILQVTTGALMVGVGLAVMTRGTWQPAVTAATKVAAPVTRLTPKTPAPKAKAKAA